MRVSKREAAQRLGCSIKTIEARCKQGKLEFVKDEDTIQNGWRGHARVWIILPDEPVRVPIPTVAQPQAIADRAPQVTVAQEKSFAEQYLAGEIPDSSGNFHGTLQRRSLLGPTDKEKPPEPRSDCTAHMDKNLIGNPGHERTENPIDSDAFQELIHPGHMERKAEMYRLCGIRPLSEQQQKERCDKLQIQAAFRWAR